MRCPSCAHEENRVLETRIVRDGAAIRRRRECASCHARFTTYEYVEAGSFQVVKRDGRREPFDRNKVMQGLAKACEKRRISRQVLEEITDQVEQEFARSGASEVSAEDVGYRVLESLRSLDPVAYVRFASVYLNFDDIQQFVDTIEGLPQRTSRKGNKSRVPGERARTP